MKERPRRRGCLGCGCLGCLGQLVGLLIAGLLFAMGILAVFAPWGYFFGGTFHFVPGWAGVGTMHSQSGDTTVYLNLEPDRRSPLGYPSVDGTAVVITPAGERHTLRLLGIFTDKWLGTDTNGRRLHLWVHRRIGMIQNDGRPRFDFAAVWRNPDLVANDRGSLSRAFTADGHAWLGSPAHAPATRESLTVVFHRCGWMDALRARYGWR